MVKRSIVCDCCQSVIVQNVGFWRALLGTVTELTKRPTYCKACEDKAKLIRDNACKVVNMLSQEQLDSLRKSNNE